MAEINVLSEIAGTVWMIEVEQGAMVEEEDAIVILESMKMEIPVYAPVSGKVVKILVSKNDTVSENQVIAIIEN